MKEEAKRNLDDNCFKGITDCIICPSGTKPVALKKGAQQKKG